MHVMNCVNKEVATLFGLHPNRLPFSLGIPPPNSQWQTWRKKTTCIATVCLSKHAATLILIYLTWCMGVLFGKRFLNSAKTIYFGLRRSQDPLRGSCLVIDLILTRPPDRTRGLIYKTVRRIRTKSLRSHKSWKILIYKTACTHNSVQFPCYNSQIDVGMCARVSASYPVLNTPTFNHKWSM